MLQEHTAAGRLDLEEFEERIELVTQARTTADLAAVMSDLPTLTPAGGNYSYVAAVGPSETPSAGWGPNAPRRSLRGPQWSGLRGWVSLSLLMVAIWAMAGFGYFWPLWVIVPTAFGAFGSLGSCGRQRVRPHGHHLSA
jgi:hypothetical protein